MREPIPVRQRRNATVFLKPFLWVIEMNIPEGFVLVPVEPTRTQLVAGLGTNGIHPIYCAVVSAAPPVDLPSYDEAKELAECRSQWDKNPNFLFSDMWIGWKACAQSRARSAE